MANYYVDLALGNDANDGLGPYKAAFTSGGTYEIQVGDTVVDDTTAATAKVVYIVHSSGSWAGGDEAGTLYVGTPSGAFTASGTISVGANSNVATLTADFAISSKLTIAALSSISAGDHIRVKKMPAASAMGVNVTFTDKSDSLTLASALTATIDNCESAWTQSANITATADTTYKKEGSKSCKLVPASAFATGKMAYFTLASPINLSSYQNVSLWVKVTADVAAGVYQLCLCSDNTGDTPVDQLTLPALAYDVSDSGLSWQKVLLKKGSALGASIASIALYALSDPGTTQIYLDHIIACNNFSLDSAIGKNDDEWHGINTIDGTTVKLFDEYRGTTETVAGYHLFDWSLKGYPTGQSTAVMSAGDAGSSGSPIKIYGGWNFSTNERDGYTGVMAPGTLGYLFSSSVSSYVNVFGFIFYQGFRHIHNTYTGGEYGDILSIAPGGHAIYSESTYSLSGKIISTRGDLSSQTPFYIGFAAGGIDITATIKLINAESTSTVGAFVLAGPTTGAADVRAGNATITGVLGAASYTLLRLSNCNSVFLKKIDIDQGYVFCLKNCGRIEVDEVTGDGGVARLVYFSDCAGVGILRVGRWSHINGTETYANVVRDDAQGWRGATMLSRYVIENFNSDSTKFVGAQGGGGFGDHVSLGYASDWGYGGTGKSLVLDPWNKDWTWSPLYYDFYIPADTSKTYKLSMQVKKSSSGANCTLSVTMHGCGMTLVENESVSLTDSWAEFQSASFTTTYKGMIHVILKALDGSTTGDIGIDAIKLVEVV